VEGKFGIGKRKYGLDRIFAKLKETAECIIALQFLVMNLEHKLKVLFIKIVCNLFRVFDEAFLLKFSNEGFSWQALFMIFCSSLLDGYTWSFI